MYAKAYSANPAMLVLTFAGTSTTSADYEEIVQSIEQLHRDASGRLAVAVIVVPKGHAAPNAHWRSRFADANRNRSGRYLLALVTESPLIRGVFTAVNWLMADKRNYHGYAVASFDEAITTFEKLEGKRLDRLRELFAEAQGRLRQGAVEPGKEVRAL
jgi:hypothetical protein